MYMKGHVLVSILLYLILGAFMCVSVAQAQIRVDRARIGCLDIQKDPNLTKLVANTCNGKTTCSYKAPTEDQYRRAGVVANTRLFCTQAMEIIYHCGNGAAKSVTVPGDAWNHAPAFLDCSGMPIGPDPLNPPPGHLRGFVDLHTHPLSNLGFGGKLLYGGVDVGSLMPVDSSCNHNVRAANEQQALGNDNSTHGGWGLDNACGDSIRNAVISGFENGLHAAEDERAHGSGYPDFPLWPVWNDLTHQKMWVEWIRRAYAGGLRVMVALAVNNKTLGDMTAGPGDYPTDDKSSADLQITEIKSFVGRHTDFMAIAYNSSDLYRIVSANKLAVVIGVEIDHIGNLGVNKQPSDAEVIAEIDRLYNEGVRYIFPIHLLDNAFGGAAAYNSIFNVSNWRESGHPYDLVCADPAKDPDTEKYKDKDIKDQYHGGFTFNNGEFQEFANIAGMLVKLGWTPLYIQSPQCPPGIGQKNQLPLLPAGRVAIIEMMRHGMLIDIDHMSQNSADATLGLGTQFGYPLNSGHNGVRGASAGSYNERALRADQYATIGRLHGMAGVGSAKLDAQQWLTLYGTVIHAMGGGVAVAAFGTDFNGLEFAMRPRPGSSVQYTSSFPPSTDGTKTWNYNRDGVAHYGMLWDFLQDVRVLPGGADMVDNNLMNGADYFFRTWQIAEAKGRAIPASGPPSPYSPQCQKIADTIKSLESERTSLQQDLKEAGPPQIPAITMKIVKINAEIAMKNTELANCVKHP